MNGWKRFDRTMLTFTRKFDRTLNHLVRPRPTLRNGRSFGELLSRQLTLPCKRRR
jgi:hypothetical protein